MPDKCVVLDFDVVSLFMIFLGGNTRFLLLGIPLSIVYPWPSLIHRLRRNSWIYLPENGI